MTDAFHRLTVVLKEGIRSDDVNLTIGAIRQIKGVVTVEAEAANVSYSKPTTTALIDAVELLQKMSTKQRILTQQGCVFSGQEWIDNHELDHTKDCYCGRPNKLMR